MSGFYNTKSFILYPGEVNSFEKSLAVDREFNPVDFFGPTAFLRAKIDILSYIDQTIVITDYKSSRKMLSESEVRNDKQLLMYMYMVTKCVTSGYKSVIIRIEYLRYGVPVEARFDMNEVSMKCAEVEEWINATIAKIEAEIQSVNGDAFKPRRNLWDDRTVPVPWRHSMGRAEFTPECWATRLVATPVAEVGLLLPRLATAVKGQPGVCPCQGPCMPGNSKTMNAVKHCSIRAML
jgi:hypothetical protein